jgi:hypothetical protein
MSFSHLAAANPQGRPATLERSIDLSVRPDAVRFPVSSAVIASTSGPTAALIPAPSVLTPITRGKARDDAAVVRTDAQPWTSQRPYASRTGLYPGTSASPAGSSVHASHGPRRSPVPHRHIPWRLPCQS